MDILFKVLPIFSIIPRDFCPIRCMSLKSLSSSLTFKMFQMYFFECIFAQFSLDSHFFSVWNPLNLSLSRWPYYSRSSNFLAFNLSSVSKYTTLPSNEEVLSSSFVMASSLLLWLLPCCYGFFIVVMASSLLLWLLHCCYGFFIVVIACLLIFVPKNF